jgi:hypothetical protein
LNQYAGLVPALFYHQSGVEMTRVKHLLMQIFLFTCLYSGQSFAAEINKSGLIGLSDTGSLKEYSFSLPQDTTVTLDLLVLDQSGGEVEVTLLLAQGVAQHLKVSLNDRKAISLAAGEYQLMVHAKLLDAEYAHIEVKVSDAKVLVDDVITLLDTKITSANTYRKIQRDFSLPHQQAISLELTDYEQLTDFPPEFESPLINIFFALSNTQSSELRYFGGIDGLQEADLSAGSYRLQIHVIASLDAHSGNDALISGLGWSLTSSSVDFENLELITSESISSGESQSVYDFGLVDFGEGGHYDFSMDSALGLNVSDEKILFVQGASEEGSFFLSAEVPSISDKPLSGIYQVFAFIPEGKSGVLEVAIGQSGSDQPFWAQVLPWGEARFLKNVTVVEDSQIFIQIKDLGFANSMQSAEFMLTNGLDSYLFTLAEGTRNLEGVVKAGNYSLLTITEAEGNALLYLDIQTDKGESLYQDYVFEGRGGFYSEVVTLSGGEYTVSAKDHALPVLGNSYSAVLLQKDQLLYKHQAFGNTEVFGSELISLTPGEYVLAFAVDPSEEGTMVLGYALSTNVSEDSFVPASTDRSLGDSGSKKSSGGSLGYHFLVALLLAVCFRTTATRRRAFP